MNKPYTVKIPIEEGKIARRSVDDAVLICLLRDSSVSGGVDARARIVIIGTVCPDDPERMYPTPEYFRYFSSASVLEAGDPYNSHRSNCLRVGAYLAFQKIILELHLDEALRNVLGSESGLILDLALFTVIEEKHIVRYYPDYAFNHPVRSEGMKIYTKEEVLKFFNSLDSIQIADFQKQWNSPLAGKACAYVAFGFIDDGSDTNGNGWNTGEAQVNYIIGRDSKNQIPRFYEHYTECNIDTVLLQSVAESASNYGYQKFKAYLSSEFATERTIHNLDVNGIDFLLAMRGCEALGAQLVETARKNIPDFAWMVVSPFGVCGTTIRKKLFELDTQERYCHIYFNPAKEAEDLAELESQIKLMSDFLKIAKDIRGYECPPNMLAYFEPIYKLKGTEQKFIRAKKRKDAIARARRLCGYFVIVTSDEMNAVTAWELHGERDKQKNIFAREMAFFDVPPKRDSKEYLEQVLKGEVDIYEDFDTDDFLDDDSLDVDFDEEEDEDDDLELQSSFDGIESSGKSLVKFVALILWESLHATLRDRMRILPRQKSLFEVSKAMEELDELQMRCGIPGDGWYYIDAPKTYTQVSILEALGMAPEDIVKQADEINRQRLNLSTVPKSSGTNLR